MKSVWLEGDGISLTYVILEDGEEPEELALLGSVEWVEDDEQWAAWVLDAKTQAGEPDNMTDLGFFEKAEEAQTAVEDWWRQPEHGQSVVWDMTYHPSSMTVGWGVQKIRLDTDGQPVTQSVFTAGYVDLFNTIGLVMGSDVSGLWTALVYPGEDPEMAEVLGSDFPSKAEAKMAVEVWWANSPGWLPLKRLDVD